jgi:hypothetical protein
MQTLVDVAEHDTSRRRYLFSETKTKLQVKNQTNQDGNIYLNNTPLGISEEEVHLGIQRRADMSNKSVITARITAGRRTKIICSDGL